MGGVYSSKSSENARELEKAVGRDFELVMLHPHNINRLFALQHSAAALYDEIYDNARVPCMSCKCDSKEHQANLKTVELISGQFVEVLEKHGFADMPQGIYMLKRMQFKNRNAHLNNNIGRGTNDKGRDLIDSAVNEYVGEDTWPRSTDEIMRARAAAARSARWWNCFKNSASKSAELF